MNEQIPIIKSQNLDTLTPPNLQQSQPQPTQTVVNITNPYGPNMPWGFFPHPTPPVVENIIIKQEEKKPDHQIINIFWGFILLVIGVMFLLRYNQIFYVTIDNGIDLYSIFAGILVFMGMIRMIFSWTNIIGVIISLFIVIASLWGIIGIGIYQSTTTSSWIQTWNIINITLPKKEIQATISTIIGSMKKTENTTSSLSLENTYPIPLQVTTGVEKISLKQSYHRNIMLPLYANNILKLNKNTYYQDLHFKSAWMSYMLDLSDIKYQNLVFESPYLDLDLIINNQIPTNTIIIKGWAVKVNLTLPPELGVEIRSKYLIGNIDLKDFNDIGSGVYKSLNYDIAKNKTLIILESIYADIETK